MPSRPESSAPASPEKSSLSEKQKTDVSEKEKIEPEKSDTAAVDDAPVTTDDTPTEQVRS